MISNLVDLLAQNIAEKTGIRTVAASNIIEALGRVDRNEEELPVIFLDYTTTPFLEPNTYEVCCMNGAVDQAYYDLDHIPVEISPILCVIASTAQEVEDIAFAIRDAYNKNSDTGIIMLSVDEGGVSIATRFNVKQLRTPVDEHPSCASTFIERADDGLKVPMAYPYADLRASLSDRGAVTRLLITYFFYLTILESNIPNKLTSEYAKLFVQKNSGDNGKERKKGFLSKGKDKLAGSKQSLFNKLRENELAASVLDSNIAQSFTGENMGNIVRDFQAGNLSREDFETYFSEVLPVLPDLYDRAIKHEPVEVTLAEAQAILAEIENRAETVANSLGIEENPADNECYRPRSLEAACVYLQTFGGDLDATMSDALEAYHGQAAQQASYFHSGEDLAKTIFTTGITAIGAAALTGFLGGTASSSGSRAHTTDKPDLLGSAGCAIAQGKSASCNMTCNLYMKCARGAR